MPARGVERRERSLAGDGARIWHFQGAEGRLYPPSSASRHPGPAGPRMESSVSMYLVELRPGKEELYRTGDELAAAIRSGDVDMHSRIYHRATSKWISVTLHPQYKAIVAERPAGPQLPPLERANWTFFNDSADALAGASDASDEPLGLKDGEDSDPNWRRPLALSITGGLLILGLAARRLRPEAALGRARGSGDAGASSCRSAAAMVGAPGVGRGLLHQHRRSVERRASYASVGDQWNDRRATPGRRASRGTAGAGPDRIARPLLPAAPRIRTKVLLKDVLATKTAPPVAATPRRTGSRAPATERAGEADRRHDAAALDRGARLGARPARERYRVVSRLSQLFAPGRLSAGRWRHRDPDEPGGRGQLRPGLPPAAGRRSSASTRIRSRSPSKTAGLVAGDGARLVRQAGARANRRRSPRSRRR